MTEYCTVKTPQFKDGVIYKWTTQSGEINTKTWVFTPDNKFTGHTVFFETKEIFEKFKVK